MKTKILTILMCFVFMTSFALALEASNFTKSIDSNENFNLIFPGLAIESCAPIGNNFTNITNVMNGSLNFSVDGTFDYEPVTNFSGVDYFLFNCTDGLENVTAWAIIGVNNTAPVAVADKYNATGNLSANILDNDTNVENDSLKIISTSVNNGTLYLDSNNGSFTYVPNKTSGVAYFKYSLSDLHLTSDEVYVIFIMNNNSAPVAVADKYNLSLNENVTDNVLDNDSDSDGDDLFAYLTADVSNGTLIFYMNGTFVYSPNTDFSGNDTFSYLVSDLDKNSTEVNVTIMVNQTTSTTTPSTTTGGGGGGSSGSGGGTIIPCPDEWTCLDWSECIDGEQQRTCTRIDVSSATCYTNMDEPASIRSCTVVDLDNPNGEADENNGQGFFSTITGAVIGAGQNPWFWLLVFLIILGIVAWIIFGKAGASKGKKK